MDANLESNIHRRLIPCSQRFGQRGEKAEWRTAAFIVDNLTSDDVGDFRILMNYNLPRDRGVANSLEIDLIVINRYGVFVIEVKNWLGAVSAHDGYWMQGESQRDDAFILVDNKAKRLHSKLFGRLGEFPDLGAVSVSGLIVLYQGTQFFQNKSQSHEENRNVFGLTTALKLALSSTEFLHRQEKSRLLEDSEIQMISERMHRSHTLAERIVGNYRLVKLLASCDLFDAFEAVSTTLTSRHVRVKRYELADLSANMAQKILNFQRDAEAVYRMESHPNIVQTFDFFPDSSRSELYYEITELVQGERLDYLMGRRQQPLPFSEQRLILVSLCEALEHAHARQVYHRNLNPETVFISQNATVKLADFDVAKVQGMETVSVDGSVLVRNNLTAPEVRNNSSSARPESDIYSLGALWYLLAALPGHPSEINLECISQFGLPTGGEQIMKAMLSRAPHQRPVSAREVRRRIDSIPDRTIG